MHRGLCLLLAGIALAAAGCDLTPPNFEVQTYLFNGATLEVEVPEGKNCGNSGGMEKNTSGQDVSVMTVECGKNKLKFKEDKLTINGASYGTFKNRDKLRLTYNGKLLVNGEPRGKQ